jgi:lysozyme family protein
MSAQADLNFQACFDFTLGAEGRFSDDASDPGNWTGGAVGRGTLNGTKYGISAAVYPALDIVNLTKDAAATIYRRDYWNVVSGDDLPLSLAMVAFDAAVNVGRTQGVKFLQAGVGAVQDGSLGPVTLALLLKGDAKAIVTEALAQRAMYYFSLPTFSTFGLGWTRRVVALAVAIS